MVAAAIAHSAAFQQIRSNERIAAKRETEILEVIRSELRITFLVINHVWKTVDWALARDINDDRRTFRSTRAVLNVTTMLPTKQFIEEAKTYSEGLSPLKRRRFLPVMHWLDQCDQLRNHDQPKLGGNESNQAFRVGVLSHAQTCFTGLADAVAMFDEDLGHIFDGRIRSDRFISPIIENMDIAFEMHVAQERQIFGNR
ncbi:hypothetical protein [Bradyrhizobium cosmicum]|uniref:hypothetical protein n=1 Tax=Bradyrhizobium cosmicum TaxID=1404864 RepID=UPI0011625D36|nr:hypothetical protein [Bradyrhizobium cosmicum]QDP22019.1 hypothetical protein FNV92_07560 [Bradyrhizobium cosmicum]